MSEPFDPYHKWLAIPPQDQPPHHYRLLGIAEFETDADVIDAAANQRMAYLQDMAAGPHTAESQKLLNEISAARRCLLNSEAKAEYDAKLKEKLQPAESPASSSSEPAQPAPATSGSPPIALISAISITVISVLIAIVIFSGPSEDEAVDKNTATLKVKWKLDEREGAYVMIDSDVVIDKPSQLPDTEVVEFKVTQGQHKVTFERTGHRLIEYKYKFLADESKSLELSWRKR